MSRPQRSWGRASFDFFASLRLSIFLLLALATTSIIGTVIPQGELPPEYLHGISPGKLTLYRTLGFFDMYHSWWFIGLLTLFCVNLVVCSIKRLPHAWRYLATPERELEDSLLHSVTDRLVIPLEGRGADLDGLSSLLRQKIGPVTVSARDGVVHLFSERHPVSRLAVYVTHLSIVIIFIGSIVGSLYGYKGYVTIVEGEKVSSVQTRKGDLVDLGFSVRCEDFSVSHYPSGAPKEFKSILTVEKNDGSTVPGLVRRPVIVNDPLSYRGITFYQSSYGKVGEHAFILSDPDGANPRPLILPSGGAAQLPDGSGICLLGAVQDAAQVQPGMTGPAAQVEVHRADGSSNTFVVYGSNAALNRANIPYTAGKLLQYQGGEEYDYTGLQVTKDPGVWIVWLGCTLMVIGICGAFLLSHRRVWIRITGKEVTVAGHANKGKAAFASTFADLSEQVRRHIMEEKQ